MAWRPESPTPDKFASPSSALEQAPLERLLCAPGRDMRFAPVADERKFGPDLRREQRRIIAVHGQATTLVGPVDGEGGDDHMAAGMGSRSQGPLVVRPVSDPGEEMENRAVVPDIERAA